MMEEPKQILDQMSDATLEEHLRGIIRQRDSIQRMISSISYLMDEDELQGRDIIAGAMSKMYQTMIDRVKEYQSVRQLGFNQMIYLPPEDEE